MTDYEEDGQHVCDHPVEAVRFDKFMWLAIVCTFLANLCRPGLVFFAAGVQLYEEFSQAMVSHSKWRDENRPNNEVIASFQEQLNQLPTTK